jgi:hypothetical protein
MNNTANPPDNIEAAHEKFKRIATEWTATKLANQGDVIADLIRPLLTQVLEWRPDELTDCKTPATPQTNTAYQTFARTHATRPGESLPALDMRLWLTATKTLQNKTNN